MSERLAHGGVPQGRPSRVAGAQAPLVTGMVSPATPFVNEDLTLSPVAFRFLNDVLRPTSANVGSIAQLVQADADLQSAIAGLQGEHAVLQGEIAALQGAIAGLATQGDLAALAGRVTSLEGRATALEGRVSAIEGRLTAAGIP